MQLTSKALAWLAAVFKERFGQSFAFSYENTLLKMQLASQEGVITFAANSAFTQASSNAPCAIWNAAEEGFANTVGGGNTVPAPCVAELPKPLIKINAENKQAHIGYDLPGLTYWMLNRIEEIGNTALDDHGRFPATSSHAHKYAYLERPIVDEWLEILGKVLTTIWPNIELSKHQFSMKLSHDVDSPSRYAFRTWYGAVRGFAGDILRKDIKNALIGPLIKITAKNKIPEIDPYNTFNWLMDTSEKHGLQSAFYFICGGDKPRSTDYRVEDLRIRQLMQNINARGHEIGLHPSYGSYQKPELIRQEADRLRKACQMAGTAQKSYGGRMHFLQWEHPTTLQAWEDAGMAYDTTLSYADRPGFRCGTCYEYPAFNPQTQQPLKIRVRPLIAMECTIIAERYMNLGYSKEALTKFTQLKENCRKVKGCFTLLWHNSHFTKKEDFAMYTNIIKA